MSDSAEEPPEARFGANEAKTGFFALLDRVERGEEVVITRRGVGVARLIPEGPGRGARRARAAVRQLAEMRGALAARGVRMSQMDIRALRGEAPR